MEHYGALQNLASIESDSRELLHAKAPSTRPTETAEIAPLIQKIGATSIEEIEKLIHELQEAKNFLFDTVRGWREAGHPVPDQSTLSAFEIAPATPEVNTGSTPDMSS